MQSEFNVSSLGRTNSDSALHTSVNNPNAASPFASPGQAVLSPTKRSAGLMDGELDSLGKGTFVQNWET
ncbi:hypothetical protein chiPu_0022876 [Chiloscyllium punctatum]|uniref:Transducer of regulated CREB activity middle domain-containing protein n=1 Tax=Chiloscyllium punctatum TaxID=137246 RepID=A0A401T9U5_CHIPU|nr:hypothetical protein [Chiloscyllium punctatum]